MCGTWPTLLPTGRLRLDGSSSQRRAAAHEASAGLIHRQEGGQRWGTAWLKDGGWLDRGNASKSPPVLKDRRTGVPASSHARASPPLQLSSRKG